MDLMDTLKTQRITLTEALAGDQGTANDQPAGGDDTVFTKEQWDTMTAALGLEPDAPVAEVVAAVTALAEAVHNAEKSAKGEGESVAAAAAVEPPVIVDPVVWQEMQRHVKVGLKATSQSHRLAAEQVVDQAIRLGKASSSQREQWIAAYQQDPDSTVHALNRAEELPRIEVGYSRNTFDDDVKMPKGWVR